MQSRVRLGQAVEERRELRRRRDDLLEVVERSRSSSRSPMCSARPFLAPSVWAIVSETSAGSRRASSPTQKTPALYSVTIEAAVSMARRVLPEPPGPVSVTRRAPPATRASTSSSSRSRPTKELAGRGRLVFEIVFSGGKEPVTELEQGDRSDVLQPVLAEIDES